MLRLSGLAAVLEVRLHEAATSGLTHREFLELILQDEVMTRDDRKMSRRVIAAGFRDQRRLEDFDFSFNPTIKKSSIFEMATSRFVQEKSDVLFLGPPGTGKSISHKVSGCLLSGVGSPFTTDRSLMWFETSFTMTRWKGMSDCFRSTSSPIS